ncbi:MAG TPA: glycogen debranching protein [Chloroflexota bacterium]|nr:glycogen debranching protein [Chloroflexota bacterium]
MVDSPFLALLRDRITLDRIPFTDRGSRMLLYRRDSHTLWLGLAEYETDPAARPVIAAWQFIDQAGSPLACRWTTDPSQVIGEADGRSYALTFADPETLLVSLPPGRTSMTLRLAMAEGTADARGGVLSRSAPSPCRLTYTTNTELARNDLVALSDGEHELRLTLDAEVGAVLAVRVERGEPSHAPERAVPAFAPTMAAAAQRWHDWFAAAPEMNPAYRGQYYYAWWVLAVNLIRPDSDRRREGVVPSKQGYVGIWHWDSYFHAIALRHIDVELARDQIRVLLAHQGADGVIPDVVHDLGVLAHTTDLPAGERARTMRLASGGRTRRIAETAMTKPPLLAWAAWILHQTAPDPTFLQEVYEPAARFLHWWFTVCDTDHNGLCEYLHPYCSGLDDSPLWDLGPPVEAPELTAYLVLQCDTMAEIARVIGKETEAAAWTARADRMIHRLIVLRWDHEAGMFWATRHGRRIPVRTPFNLLPLITGRLPAGIADRMVVVLTDGRRFWPRFPVPTVALDDPAYSPTTMWRGPVWLNINYLLITALNRGGYQDVARSLQQRTLELAMGQDDLIEYYNSETGGRPPRAASTFSWSAAVCIELAIAESRLASRSPLPGIPS